MNKSGGGKGPLDRPDIYSKDPELVTHLQMMLVTPGNDPGTYGPDKDGVDWGFSNDLVVWENVKLDVMPISAGATRNISR